MERNIEVKQDGNHKCRCGQIFVGFHCAARNHAQRIAELHSRTAIDALLCAYVTEGYLKTNRALTRQNR